MQAKCIEVSVAVLYVVLVSLFLGWGFLHRKEGKTSVPRTKPVVNVTDAGVIRNMNRQKDENIPMQVSASCRGISLSSLTFPLTCHMQEASNIELGYQENYRNALCLLHGSC